MTVGLHTGCPISTQSSTGPRTLDRARLLLRLAASGRDVVSYTVGSERNVLLNHPDHAKHVLGANRKNYTKDTGANLYFRAEVADGVLTAEGDRWRQQRDLLTPAFRDTPRLRAAADAAVADLVTELDHAAGDGAPINLSAAIARVTLSITTRALFGLGYERFIGHCTDLGVVLDGSSALLPTPGSADLAPRDALYREVRSAVAGLAPECRGPALAALAQDPAHAGEALHQQIVTLLLAGYETTANSLTWTWILLMRHPELYARWQELLDTGSDDAARYTRALFDETLRLYPSAWVIGRRAVSDDVVGTVAVPAGASVTISPFLLHRHPEFWCDPEEFRPERFLAGGVKPTHRYAYIPFGAGHRFCVGSAYAHEEAALILGAIGRRFVLRPVGSADARPDHKFVLRAPDPFAVTVHRRA